MTLPTTSKWPKDHIFTDRIRSMALEGTMFTGVCHSFRPQGGRRLVMPGRDGGGARCLVIEWRVSGQFFHPPTRHLPPTPDQTHALLDMPRYSQLGCILVHICFVWSPPFTSVFLPEFELLLKIGFTVSHFPALSDCWLFLAAGYWYNYYVTQFFPYYVGTSSRFNVSVNPENQCFKSWSAVVKVLQNIKCQPRGRNRILQSKYYCAE